MRWPLTNSLSFKFQYYQFSVNQAFYGKSVSQSLCLVFMRAHAWDFSFAILWFHCRLKSFDRIVPSSSILHKNLRIFSFTSFPLISPTESKSPFLQHATQGSGHCWPDGLLISSYLFLNPFLRTMTVALENTEAPKIRLPWDSWVGSCFLIPWKQSIYTLKSEFFRKCIIIRACVTPVMLENYVYCPRII